jgi:hypothetical protein
MDERSAVDERKVVQQGYHHDRLGDEKLDCTGVGGDCNAGIEIASAVFGLITKVSRCYHSVCNER